MSGPGGPEKCCFAHPVLIEIQGPGAITLDCETAHAFTSSLSPDDFPEVEDVPESSPIEERRSFEE